MSLLNDLVEALIKADLSKRELIYLLEHVEECEISSLKSFWSCREVHTKHKTIGCWECDSIERALTQDKEEE